MKILIALILAAASAFAEAPAMKVIPGLAPVDVYLSLTEKGFSVKKTFGEGLATWTCRVKKDYSDYLAEVLGNGPSSVSVVRASIINTDGSANADGTVFLGFIATILYEGSAPEKAKQWVTDNIGEKAETEIGGVTFQLLAPSRFARILTISAK